MPSALYPKFPSLEGKSPDLHTKHLVTGAPDTSGPRYLRETVLETWKEDTLILGFTESAQTIFQH